jgi:DNA-directed RNA polymerase subunit beta
LKNIYDDADISAKIDKSDEASLKKMAVALKDGIHVGTPVFDGASEADVRGSLKKAELAYQHKQSCLMDVLVSLSRIQ